MSRVFLTILTAILLFNSAFGLTGSAKADAQPISQVQNKSIELLPRQQEIELALSAAPEHLRKDATVYVFSKQGYEKVRSGTNSFTCLVNRDGSQNGDTDFRPTCWDAEGSETIVPVVLRVGELLAQEKSAAQIKQDIDAGYSDGRFNSPRKAGIAYMLCGDVQLFNSQTGKVEKRSFPPHYMIYAPYVTSADIGMTSEEFKKNSMLPIVYSGYSGGAHSAYIIVMAVEKSRAGNAYPTE